MSDMLANALRFDHQALALRARRQKVLANNIANADTPGYKARDFDFSQALSQALETPVSGQGLALETTSPRHIPGHADAGFAPELLYRVPMQPSLDGNTVDMNVERSAFADNTVRYRSALQFISGKIRGLKAAMQPAP